MQALSSWIDSVSSFVWGPFVLIPLLVLVGLILTIGLKFLAFRKTMYAFGVMWRGRKAHPEHEGELTPFRALMTSLAATVGTGNIVGVATAILLGGPGAVFWMWVTALVGMSTKFCEATLAVRFREVTPHGSFVGGPMYYIKNGLGENWKWLATLFAIFGAVASFGIGNMAQANSITSNVAHVLVSQENTQTASYIVAGILFLLTSIIVVGGVKRIGAVAGTLVPIMAVIYVLSGLVILLIKIDQVPQAFWTIVESAFTGHAAAGGFVGSTIIMAIRYGVARGLFSNEAGLGSSPMAHATAIVKHPVKQGLLGMIDPFIDTIIVCSISGLVIMVSGQWTNEGMSAGVLTQTAFDSILPGSRWIVVISLVLFAYSTILGWCVYGERCIIYLLGERAALPFRIFFTCVVPVGSLMKLSLVWNLSDLFNGLMAIPNLIALVLLLPVVIKLTKEYFDAPQKYE
ncbi:MAG: sodium:alanine symporter family protein [Burkholderiales bacterium]|jgi:AGCS family alanine or glycine:cation symporter|nr:sodium:alanine symporter family protein [Burkholderiales bacterium]